MIDLNQIALEIASRDPELRVSGSNIVGEAIYVDVDSTIKMVQEARENRNRNFGVHQCRIPIKIAQRIEQVLAKHGIIRNETCTDREFNQYRNYIIKERFPELIVDEIYDLPHFAPVSVARTIEHLR